jgi:hypothetical protein
MLAVVGLAALPSRPNVSIVMTVPEMTNRELELPRVTKNAFALPLASLATQTTAQRID